MCAEYQIKIGKKIVEEELGTAVRNVSPNEAWDLRVKMTMAAPVLGMKDGEVRLNELVFPAVPFPNARLSQIASNKTGHVDSVTDEQIIRISSVPLWKTGFEKYPCVVPMTSFFEPAYWGKHQGDVMEFKDPHDRLLFVPAILIKGKKPFTGKLNGFSLLTHTASPQMIQFHHRLLVLLEPAQALEYLRLGDIPAEERFEFLIRHRYVPKLKTSVDRKMAKGWEKRVEQHRRSLADEERYLEALKREAVAG